MASRNSQPAPPDPDKYNEAIRAFRRLVPMTDEEFAELEADAQRDAFRIANVNNANVVRSVFEEHARAIEDGVSFQESKPRLIGMLAEEWGSADSFRVETMFRTNLNRAFNEARWEVFDAPTVREDRPYFQIDTIDDQRRSEICEHLDGIVRPADDPWWRTHWPPYHQACRTQVRALTREEAEEEGITPEPPEGADPADGFGRAPNTAGADWEPDLSNYPPEIAAELGRRLAAGE